MSSVGSHSLGDSDGNFGQGKARPRASPASQTSVEVREHGHDPLGGESPTSTPPLSLIKPACTEHCCFGGDPTEESDSQQKAVRRSSR